MPNPQDRLSDELRYLRHHRYPQGLQPGHAILLTALHDPRDTVLKCSRTSGLDLLHAVKVCFPDTTKSSALGLKSNLY